MSECYEFIHGNQLIIPNKTVNYWKDVKELDSVRFILYEV
jgi:hypothetical protein